MNFLDYTSRPQRHLTHLEDLVLDGPDGVRLALEFMRELSYVLKGLGTRHCSISTKWDGSPAIVFGPDPANGRFFVSTKAAFNKQPKLAKTHEDIDAMYTGGSSGGRNRILHLALDELPALGVQVPVQADFLFSAQDSLLLTHEGELHFAFQPNTILYAIGPGDVAYTLATKAAIGLALHTEFGPDWTPSPLAPLTYARLKHTSRVFAVNSRVDSSLVAGATAEDWTEFEFADMMVARHARNLNYRVFDAVSSLREYLDRFFNQLVRLNLRGDVKTLLREFVDFLEQRMKVNVASRTSSKGKVAQYEKFRDLQNLVYQNRADLEKLLSLRSYLEDAKLAALPTLAQTSFVKTFMQTSTGIVPTAPEGFVITDRTSGVSVKLVDRYEFSRQNFARHDAR